MKDAPVLSNSRQPWLIGLASRMADLARVEG